MSESARRPAPASGSASARWWTWTGYYVLPCTAVVLAGWVPSPHTTREAYLAVGLTAMCAALLGVTMPVRRSTKELAVRDAVLAVVLADSDPQDGTVSDTYELRVHGVSVLVRLRGTWKDQRLVPYVHIDHDADRPRLLLVEVDNQGETEYR